MARSEADQNNFGLTGCFGNNIIYVRPKGEARIIGNTKIFKGI